MVADTGSGSGVGRGSTGGQTLPLNSKVVDCGVAETTRWGNGCPYDCITRRPACAASHDRGEAD